MYWLNHEDLCVLYCHFTKNNDIHVYDTRQKCHNHMPLYGSNLGKRGLRYMGASIWNIILSVNINPNFSEFIFPGSQKYQCVITYFDLSYIPRVLLMYNCR